MKTVYILIGLMLTSLLVGCGGGSDTSTTETPLTRENAPQPNIANEALRPPKPPSI